MDSEQFKAAARDMVDYVAGYLDTIESRRVVPDLQPGYIKELIPDHAPEDAEPWSAVLGDLDRVIMPGITHWHNPRFHAFYPTANSYPAILGDMLSDAIGCIGFTWVSATLGTTDCCSFDDLLSIGPVAQKHELYMHIDAAYAGAAFICPEYRHLLNGVEFADSFNFNPHKWMLVTFDCSALWLKNSSEIVDAFNVDPIYLKHDQQGLVPDYRHWQIPLGRRFRSLKLWFVLRLYGAKQIRAHLRKQIALAERFAQHVKSDARFDIPVKNHMGLVCFRLKEEPNETTEKLLNLVNGNGKIFVVPAKLRGSYVIRFCVCARTTEEKHIDDAWNEISSLAAKAIEMCKK
ncbi:unnamed protein product [Notodromas monacha]|uniref:Aromatic-L-amino-acid decarboxylase n=1 Tax=Notodromas monacha TaxID=399045 RepID=A0A7R9C1Y3_9CRUS|nr:unnamed protein product [Notodromas monacha]CAG0924594.1 unnamed protein product [Notodromas monacha]